MCGDLQADCVRVALLPVFMKQRESRKKVLMSIEATDGASDAAAAVGLHVATGPSVRRRL